MIRRISTLLLDEFSNIAIETVLYFEKQGVLKNVTKKEVLKFEVMAYIFWFLQVTNVYSRTWKKLLLDEIHKQYYEQLKKHGYDSKMCKLISNDLNLRYRTYHESFGIDQDLAQVDVKFCRFLAKKSQSETDLNDTMIPMYLMNKLIPKLEEYRKVMTQ